MKWKKHLWGILYGLALAGFTAYVLMDTFVIARVYTQVAPEEGSEGNAETGGNGSGGNTGTGGTESGGNAETGGTESGGNAGTGGTESGGNEGTGETGSGDTDGSQGEEKGRHKGKMHGKHSSVDDESDGTQSGGSDGAQSGGSDGAQSGESDGSDGAQSGESASDQNSEKEETGGQASGTELESFQDGGISISLMEYREYDTNIYVADVQLSSAESLKTAFAQSSYGRNVTAKTSEIAEENGAILAINGDYYGSQERGYVLRNGTIYRDEAESGQEDLVIYQDGSMDVIEETETSAEQLLADGARQALSFGPALVKDGKVAVSEGEEVGTAMASNPRTAIAVLGDLHYLFVVSDGRTDESEGLSLYQLAGFLESLGASTAYNLDGGGSSTMVFQGEVVNHPTTSGRSIKERSVSDIVYIGN